MGRPVRICRPWQLSGTVTLEADSGTQDWATCSITVRGTVISQITTRKTSGKATCQGVIPGNLAAAPGGGTRMVVLHVDAFTGDTVTYSTPAGEERIDMPSAAPPPGGGSYSEPGSDFTKTVSVRAGGIVTIHTFSRTNGPITCSITANGTVFSQATSSGYSDKGTCWARVP